jgi:hypothetical protein
MLEQVARLLATNDFCLVSREFGLLAEKIAYRLLIAEPVGRAHSAFEFLVLLDELLCVGHSWLLALRSGEAVLYQAPTPNNQSPTDSVNLSIWDMFIVSRATNWPKSEWPSRET